MGERAMGARTFRELEAKAVEGPKSEDRGDLIEPNIMVHYLVWRYGRWVKDIAYRKYAMDMNYILISLNSPNATGRDYAEILIHL